MTKATFFCFCYSKEHFLKPLLKTESDHTKQEEYKKKEIMYMTRKKCMKEGLSKKYGPRIRAGLETKNG